MKTHLKKYCFTNESKNVFFITKPGFSPLWDFKAKIETFSRNETIKTTKNKTPTKYNCKNLSKTNSFRELKLLSFTEDEATDFKKFVQPKTMFCKKKVH